MKRTATAAILAQGTQAGVSFVLQILVLRLLGIDDYGRFAVLYGIIVLAMAVVSGLVGDSLVVLHRELPSIRAGLELTTISVTTVLGLLAVGAGLVTGFVTPVEAAAFGLALVAFVVMEVIRRLMIAHFAYVRIIVADLLGFTATGAGLLACAALDALSLAGFLFAVSTGQLVSLLVGWRFIPKDDRVLVPLRNPDLRSVWRYGTWRALQQTLRPALFTTVRVLVVGYSGVAAVGMLEAGRTYVSPLVLVVGGFSSLLFVRFAERAKSGGAGSLREADRVVGALIVVSVMLSLIALALRPWIGPLLFGLDLDLIVVLAWIVYGISVAMVTPYGALSAVSGRQSAVFFVRLADTAAGVAVTLVILTLGAPYVTVPFALAVTSALGGLALRWIATRGEQASK
ncbi:lipopolysaccharide biosynthesis protein [Leucobacter sp. HY1910]